MSENLLKADPSLRGNVQRGLDYLAVRLEPIIAARLAANLGGLPWTEILHQLDAMKGRTARAQSAADLQAQLRMLTERLGGLGHPFDDDRRNVSRLGSELRLVRNTLAHGGAFTPADAWRAHDSAARLLSVLGDDAGAAGCTAIRDELQPVLPGSTASAASTGSVASLSNADRPQMPEVELRVPPEPAPRLFDAEVEAGSRDNANRPSRSAADATPEAEVFERADAIPTPVIGQRRMEFEAWEVSVVGSPEVLDSLRRLESKEQVRALAAEIVDFEGPIHIDRLTSLIARSFGVGKLHAKRQKAILHQLRQCDFNIDGDDFAWPIDLDSATWMEFRPSSDPERAFLHVSPVELRNAMSFLEQRHPSLGRSELYRRVLQTFGRKRLTKQFLAHLELINVSGR